MFALLWGSGIPRCACLLSQWAQDISGLPWMLSRGLLDDLHPPNVHMISPAAWDIRSPLHPDGVPSPTPHAKQHNCRTCDEQCLHHQTKPPKQPKDHQRTQAPPPNPTSQEWRQRRNERKARSAREDGVPQRATGDTPPCTARNTTGATWHANRGETVQGRT